MVLNKRSVTITDVARVAGVSVSTVSRVINDKDDVSEETYNHVKSIIDELGYSSSLAARSMRSRSTNVIGLIMPDIDDPFSIEVMRGVNRAIVDFEYDLLVYTNGDIRKNTSAAREQQYVSLLNNSITDGVIIVTPVAATFSSPSPVVAIDPNLNTPTGPAVISTNYLGAKQATDYLISLGHRRIAHITGRSDLLSSVRRQQGFEDALKDAEIAIDPELVCAGNFTTQKAVECAQQLLMLEHPPTAIFAANDQSAFGVMQAAEEIGFRIPDDLSLVGFDDIPQAAFMNLTTVDQSISEMGYTGTQMLLDLIQGKPLETEVLKVDTKLIIRNSCRSI